MHRSRFRRPSHLFPLTKIVLLNERGARLAEKVRRHPAFPYRHRSRSDPAHPLQGSETCLKVTTSALSPNPARPKALGVLNVLCGVCKVVCRCIAPVDFAADWNGIAALAVMRAQHCAPSPKCVDVERSPALPCCRQRRRVSRHDSTGSSTGQIYRTPFVRACLPCPFRSLSLHRTHPSLTLLVIHFTFSHPPLVVSLLVSSSTPDLSTAKAMFAG